MALTMWGQVVIQATTPAESPVEVGTLWVDTSGTATLKVCTAISPFTFSAITSGGGTWGSITGTLSNQTDLQAALDAKAIAARVLTSGGGLTGGGDLSADRTLAVGAGTGITVNADDVALDTTSTRNVDHAAVSVIAGGGLTGGGTIAADRTVAVGAGTGITVNADDIAVNYGTTGVTACVGNDSRLSDARTPSAHATSHKNGGSDEIAVAVAAANAIPKAGAGAKLAAGWMSNVLAASDLTDGTTGSGAVVLAASPTLTGSPLAPTPAVKDNSTKIATTAYVDNAVLGQNFKEACKYGTTAALPSATYSNGSSGSGATLTAVGFGALTFDGSTPSVGDRILVKNQTSTLQNGLYTVTIVGGVATLFVLTRTTDFDQSTDINTGDSAFVTSGTTLSATTWAYTGIDAPTMGTTAITFVQTAGQGALSAGTGITITGNSIAVDQTALALDAFAATTDITTRNASTSAHGLLKRLSNVATEYMDGQGNWSTPSTGAVTRLYTNTGTNTNAAAADFDSFAVSGLTAKDILLVEVYVEAITQDTAGLKLWHVTDGITFGPLSGDPLTAGTAATLKSTLCQSQDSTTRVLHRGIRIAFVSAVINGVAVDAAPTTVWTGSWTLGLHHGGVTAGGTLRYRWNVYKLAGQ